MSDVIEVKLPELTICFAENPGAGQWFNKVKGTRAQLEAMQQAIAEALQPKVREWRDGDIALHADGQVCVRTNNDRMECWIAPGTGTRFGDADMERAIFLNLNLGDVLAQGPIVIGMSEEEAEHLKRNAVPTDVGRAIHRKVCAALTAYRETKGPAPLERSAP